MERKAPDTRTADDGKPKKRIECPKCRTLWPKLDEVYSAGIQWTWDTTAERYTCDGEFFGPISGVTATCKKCEHIWTLRKAPQITSVLTIDFGNY